MNGVTAAYIYLNLFPECSLEELYITPRDMWNGTLSVYAYNESNLNTKTTKRGDQIGRARASPVEDQEFGSQLSQTNDV